MPWKSPPFKNGGFLLDDDKPEWWLGLPGHGKWLSFLLNTINMVDSPWILLMEEILHQLVDTSSTSSHYLRVFYIPRGAGFLALTVPSKWWIFHGYISLREFLNESKDGVQMPPFLGPGQCLLVKLSPSTRWHQIYYITRSWPMGQTNTLPQTLQRMAFLPTYTIEIHLKM